MLDPKVLDELSRKLSDAIPPGITQIKSDIERNIRGILSAKLSEMDLVSREEFEVQTAVLARTRAKLEALERKVAALEAQLEE